MVRSIPRMSSRTKFMLRAAVVIGFCSTDILALYVDDLQRRTRDSRVRRMPTYSRGNPAGWGRVRTYKHYGAPFYGSDLGLSAEGFRSHFMFGHDQFPVVLRALHLPQWIEYQPGCYVQRERALLIFLKRIRTRGSCLLHLEDFFGRSHGYISGVYKAVLAYVDEHYLSRQIRRVDPNIFHSYRLRDYETCFNDLAGGRCLLKRLICFIDGSFHPTCRPGAPDYHGLLQRAFYSGHHKDHGLNFEFLTFPDGIIGRCFGPVEGRHHDMYLARESGLLDLFTTGPLRGFVGYGDKAYIGLEPFVYHPFYGLITRLERLFNESMSSLRVEVEHNIGHVYSRCGFIQHDLRLATENPGVAFQAAVFLQNIHTCLLGNQTSIRFMCAPPTIDEYLYQE